MGGERFAVTLLAPLVRDRMEGRRESETVGSHFNGDTEAHVISEVNNECNLFTGQGDIFSFQRGDKGEAVAGGKTRLAESAGLCVVRDS